MTMEAPKVNLGRAMSAPLEVAAEAYCDRRAASIGSMLTSTSPRTMCIQL
jgi:hypothetical protein